MSEMIDRVALAICGDDNPENILAIHRIRARAAIEAMREPTDEMIRAGDEAGGGAGKKAPWPVTDGVWFAMITAALSEKP